MAMLKLHKFLDELDEKHSKRLCGHSPPYFVLEVLHDACVANNVDMAIEVGTYLGYSGLFIASAVNHLHTIDIKLDNLREAAKFHKAAGLTNISYCCGDSLQFLPKLMEELSGKFQFAYIDSKHFYDHVLAEYKILSAHIASPGCICFDDADMLAPGDPIGMPAAMKEIGATVHPVNKRLAYKTFGDFKFGT